MPGDTFYELTEAYYGHPSEDSFPGCFDGWLQAIMDANPDADPENLEEDQIVTIPWIYTNLA